MYIIYYFLLPISHYDKNTVANNNIYSICVCDKHIGTYSKIFVLHFKNKL